MTDLGVRLSLPKLGICAHELFLKLGSVHAQVTKLLRRKRWTASVSVYLSQNMAAPDTLKATRAVSRYSSEYLGGVQSEWKTRVLYHTNS
jgi:hypothetical protein